MSNNDDLWGASIQTPDGPVYADEEGRPVWGNVAAETWTDENGVQHIDRSQGTAEKDVGRYRDMGGQSGYVAQIEKIGREGSWRPDQSRLDQRNAMELQRQAAIGNAPSQAEILGKTMADQGMATQLSMAAGARGGPMAQAAAMRQAQTGQAGYMQTAQNQMAGLRANEMAQARGAYSGAADSIRGYDLTQRGQDIGQRGQDIDVAKSQAGLTMDGRRMDEANRQFFEQLAWNTRKADLDARRGNVQDATNQRMGERAASETEKQNSFNNAKDIATIGIGGASGMMEGDRKTDTSDVRAKVPAGSLGRLMVSDKEAAALKGRADKEIGGMRSRISTEGAAVGGKKAERLSYGSMDDGPEFSGGIFRDMRGGSPQTLNQAMEASTAGANPYARAPEAPARGITGAPMGYAASRAGQAGAMAFRPASAAGPSLAPGSQDYAKAMRHSPDARGGGFGGTMLAGRKVATSDDRAKVLEAERKAYLLGRAHETEAKATGKPVEFAYGGAPRKGEDIVDRDPMKGMKPKPAQKTASSKSVALPERDEVAEGRKTLISGLDTVGAAGAFPPAAGVLMPYGLAKTVAGGAKTGVEMATRPDPVPSTAGYVPDMRAQVQSDERTKKRVKADEPMAQANRSMVASAYSYKPEHLPPEQEPGEVNVGPMAQNMARDPVARNAIVTQPDGMLAIDTDKALKQTMGGLASLQMEVDRLKKKRGAK